MAAKQRARPEGETLTAARAETREPQRYRVLMHNDHYTPMDFVVQILRSVFHKPAVEAEEIMLTVHYRGVGVCGCYPAQIAETKVKRVHSEARAAGYPLRCSLEPES